MGYIVEVFDWCGKCGVQKIMYLVRTLIDIIRWVVPIGLVIMTSLDVVKKVINPDDKEGQKKIMHRVIAAIVVFFIPLFMRLILGLVDIGLKNGSDPYKGAQACWDRATLNCSTDK